MKRKSLRQSINDKCRECIYDPLSGLGNWRQQVGACECTDCPLWPVRPVSRGSSVPAVGVDLNEAIGVDAAATRGRTG